MQVMTALHLAPDPSSPDPFHPVPAVTITLEQQQRVLAHLDNVLASVRGEDWVNAESAALSLRRAMVDVFGLDRR